MLQSPNKCRQSCRHHPSCSLQDKTSAPAPGWKWSKVVRCTLCGLSGCSCWGRVFVHSPSNHHKQNAVQRHETGLYAFYVFHESQLVLNYQNDQNPVYFTSLHGENSVEVSWHSQVRSIFGDASCPATCVTVWVTDSGCRSASLVSNLGNLPFSRMGLV